MFRVALPTRRLRFGARSLTLPVAAILSCGRADSGRIEDPLEFIRAAHRRMSHDSGSAGGGHVDRPFMMYASGTLNQGAELQGRHAGRTDTSLFRETIVILPDGRIGHEYEHHRIDGTHDLVREIYKHGSKTIHVLEQGFSVRLTDGPEVSGIDRVRRRLPHLLLGEATAESSNAVSASGSTTDAYTIEYELESGPRLTLSFARSDTALGAVTYTGTHPGLGDTEVRWTFGDYRRIPGVGVLPHDYRVEIAGAPFLAMQVDSVVLDSVSVYEFFETPDDFDPPIEVPPSGGDASSRARVQEIAEHVFIVRNLRTGFHPMFVEFDDFIVAVDAPAGYPIMIELPAGDVAPGPAPDWLARRYIELIRETIPNKPVRYVVVTHFHNDHGGGVRAFVAEGATVVTTAADEDAVRAFVTAPHDGAPDRLSETDAPLQLEVVADSRTIADGQMTLEVLSTGANPHTDDMLVVSLPDRELMYVSDLMNSLPQDLPPTTTFDPPLAFFLEWLVERGLNPATIYTMHGSAAIERAQWQRAYQLVSEGG